MEATLPVAGSLPVRAYRWRVSHAVYWALAAVATGVSAVLAATAETSHPGLDALARALLVAVPAGVGLYAIRVRPGERFGALLVATGALCFVTTLGESGSEVPYTIGRAAGWIVEVALVYLVLAFPAGRLPGRADRLLVAAIAVAVLTLYVPRLVLAKTFEVPSPWTSCVRDCPGNALFALQQEPAFVADVMRPVGVTLVFLVLIAVVARLWRRTRAATPLGRRMLIGVLAVGAARAALVGTALVARQVDPGAEVVRVASWLLTLAIPALAIAFLVALLRWRLFAGGALQHLAQHVRGLPDPTTLRQTFAEAFDDPAIEIAFPKDGAWTDSCGQPVQLPQPGNGRSVSEIRSHDAVVAVLIHDEALVERPELVESGAALAAVVIENHRLTAEAEGTMQELRRSRARIAAGAAGERRRIERDLHDGAQQRLVALRIELELAEDIVRQDPERAAARLRELEGDLDEALEELRRLAHGVYPPLLADRGLPEALRSVAARSAMRVDVHAHTVRRYGTDVESAVYFCVLEALQNTVKHATGARAVVVTLESDDDAELRFSVRDDGCGASAIRPGAGITNMRDRLAAIGGELEVRSTPGIGTTVRGRAPLPRGRAG